MSKIAIVCIFLFNSSQLLAKQIVWSGDQESTNIGQQVYFLEDPLGTYSVEDVMGKSDLFQLSEKKILNFENYILKVLLFLV